VRTLQRSINVDGAVTNMQQQISSWASTVHTQPKLVGSKQVAQVQIAEVRMLQTSLYAYYNNPPC
jgi:hypothetical protein